MVIIYKIKFKTKKIICFVIIIIFFLYLIKNEKKLGQNHIFTFWEPHNNIPGYLLLCLETWKKVFPEYEIIILDYKKTKKFIGKNLFLNIICENMTMPLQADAIRVALLKKYGGIWMDIDTIAINNGFLSNLKGFEMSMLGFSKPHTQNLAFIYSTKNSTIIEEWLRQIIIKVKIYKNAINEMKTKKKINETFWNNINAWNYLGNGILDNLVKNISFKKFYRLDNNELNVFPELYFLKNSANSALSMVEKYKQFYFTDGDAKKILNKSKSLILLHNSWTPLRYKNMSKNEFLKQKIMISKIFRILLNK